MKKEIICIIIITLLITTIFSGVSSKQIINDEVSNDIYASVPTTKGICIAKIGIGKIGDCTLTGTALTDRNLAITPDSTTAIIPRSSGMEEVNIATATKTTTYTSTTPIADVITSTSEGNHPPDKPTKPTGPTNGQAGESYHYESYFTDPDGDSLEVYFDWGDGTNTGWIGPITSGLTVGNYHTWNTDGTYQVKTKARDIPNNEISQWSEPLTVTIGEVTNQPPNKPTTPTGPSNGKTGASLHFESVFTDPDGDSMEVYFDWGDGTNTGWIGIVTSGSAVGNYHTYTTDGTYSVKTKAKDIPNLEESPWSDPHSITTPKNKKITIEQLCLKRLTEKFPYSLFNILKYLIRQ